MDFDLENQLPIHNDKFAEHWVDEDIYNFPIVYTGTERWIRDTYPNFPEEFYSILAMRNSGMKWATYKKLLRQEKKTQDKATARAKKNKNQTIIRTGENVTITF